MEENNAHVPNNQKAVLKQKKFFKPAKQIGNIILKTAVLAATIALGANGGNILANNWRVRTTNHYSWQEDNPEQRTRSRRDVMFAMNGLSTDATLPGAPVPGTRIISQFISDPIRNEDNSMTNFTHTVHRPIRPIEGAVGGGVVAGVGGLVKIAKDKSGNKKEDPSKVEVELENGPSK